MENEHSKYPIALSAEDMPKFVNEIPHPERVKDEIMKVTSAHQPIHP